MILPQSDPPSTSTPTVIAVVIMIIVVVLIFLFHCTLVYLGKKEQRKVRPPAPTVVRVEKAWNMPPPQYAAVY
ncbi:hypothetical protein L596_026213 [Steinernema carpocapsae]|uniref:Uncharacterized protein n=1 Tax=Steinernema carpocapsae TaxID=34508 RepID=A0A4U5M0P6_STECR|nr:hypothetical protein L596_026213 [Steinernema carpocapsae]